LATKVRRVIPVFDSLIQDIPPNLILAERCPHPLTLA
jgi:hypothetical protein